MRLPMGRMSAVGALRNDTPYETSMPSALASLAGMNISEIPRAPTEGPDASATAEKVVTSPSAGEPSTGETPEGGSLVPQANGGNQRQGEELPEGPVAPAISEREMHVVASVEEWNRGLTRGALLKKYQMLGQSPIAFFTGTNHLFWADLSGDPHLTKFGNSTTTTWICGNCTYQSFSAFGSDAEGPLYGLDSFEEALVADYQYDVWRLAVSIALLVRERIRHFGKVGGKEATEVVEDMQGAAVKAMAQGYLAAVAAYRAPEDRSADSPKPVSASGSGTGTVQKGLISLRSHSESNAGKLSKLLSLTGGDTKGLLVRFLGVVERELSRRKLIKRWCGDVTSGNKVAFLTKESAVEPCPQYEADDVVSALGSQYADGVNVKALARRLNVSAATCGAPRFVALIEKEKDFKYENKELHILDVCMQQKPTAYHFMNPSERSAYLLQHRNEAQRYAAACQALSLHDQHSTSWISLQGVGIHPAAWGCYSVRDLSPFYEQYPVSPAEDAKTKMKGFGVSSKEALVELSEAWGRILGTQHTHAAAILEEQKGRPLEAGQQPVFAKEIASMVGNQEKVFCDLACQIAVAYSRQVLHDWQVFLRFVLSRE